MWPSIRTALWLPFTGPGWPRKLAIGAATSLALEALFAGLGALVSGVGGVGVAPLAVMVNLPLLGYAAGVFTGALQGRPAELPEWADWGGLAATGLFLALVGLAYGLVPLLMILVGLNFLVRGGLLLSLGLALVTLGLLAALGILFFLPMGVGRYVAEERIEAAFRPAALWAAIARVLGEYVTAYALGMASAVVGGVVAFVPLVGPLAAAFLAFYLLVAYARLFGEVCGRALGVPGG